MNIYFLRHGETEENVKKTYYGDIDCSLNDRGIAQCLKAKEYLKGINFDKVFISCRKRTFESAELVLQGRNVEFVKDTRINELSFGRFEGLTYDEVCRNYPEEQRRWMEDWKGFCPTDGESCLALYKRVKSFVEDLKGLDDENILVVTHGGVVRMVYSYILKEDMDMYWKFSSKNGDISLIKYEYGNFFIDSIVHIEGF